MSESSPLRDPVFLLTWQVHLSVVILFALLGIWAGMTRRPWYIAPTLFLALLWLFVPLEAPEPAVVLLLTVPVLAIACRIARRWLETPDAEPRKDSPSRLRFSLRDLLWLMVLVGMGTALLMQVKRLPWNIEWRDTVISATFFTAIGVTTVVVSRQQRWKPWLTSWMALAVLIAAASVCHYYLVRSQWLLLGWGFHFIPFFSYPNRDLHVFGNPLLTFVEFALLVPLCLGCLLPADGSASQTKLFNRVVSGSCLVFLCSVLAICYIAILRRPAWPSEPFPEQNEREALLSILASYEKLNLPSLEQRKRSVTVNEVPELLAELEVLMARDTITLFDSRSDRPSSSLGNTEDPSQNGEGVAKWIVEMLVAQAKIDFWLAERHDRAIDRDLLALRLAKVYQRRATLFSAQMGIESESIVMTQLTQIRSELTPEDIARLLPELDEIARTREPFELTLLRDSVIDDRTADWRLRWTITARRILGMPPLKHQEKLAFDTRDARLAMLRTDLALRAYRHKHGQWPESLNSLVPDELPAVPTDPFSHQPLVYRVAGDDFILYSRGQNRTDDGGRFGTANEHQNNDKDIDLFLDAWLPYAT